MLKHSFVLAFMAILFLLKPSFVKAEDSSDAEVDSSTDYNRRKCVCRKNEVMSDCIEGGCQAKTCSDLDRDVPCIKINPKYCTKGCLCKDGYLRADNGTCVPISSCTLKCTRSNEVFSSCPETCPPQTCESINKIYHCPLKPTPVNTTNCRPACVCKPGYFKNKIKECISKDNCLKCTGPNEYYSCGGACDNICATLSEQNQTNCPIVNIVCNKMCYCEEGYARAKNNTCIPFDRCTEPQCPVNEKYVQCPSALCTPKTCSQLGFPLNCTFASNDDECDEKPGCICIDGYVRNHKGVCIPKNNCPSCGGDKNAEPGCGVNCGRHCSNYFHKGGFACPAICLLNGCQCKPGMYYDDVLKKCVKPEDCTPICSKNEVVSNCVNGGCDKRNCSQLNGPILCIDPITCKKGCVCAEGYLRHPNETCVPINECPSCGDDPNAIPGCGINCNKHCYNIGNEPQACIAICYENACNCKEGYYFDDNIGKCVLPEQCTPVCGKDEVYNSCIQGQCQPKNCSDLGKPIACPRIDPKYCIKGCLCKDGYVRAKNGTCIPKKDCPSCGGDYNAQAGCGENCNKKCSDIGKEEQSCIEICYENGCDCKDGFYYDENRKKCVRRDACSTCGGDPNAVPGCGLNCNKHCSNVGKGKGICPRIQCPPNGCECKDGYYFDSTVKKCVLPEDCCPSEN